MCKERSYFDKETFNIIKGVAVVLLFFHHFFTFPEFYPTEYNGLNLLFYEKYFQFSTNLCVAIFAFLTGYGFWFSENKSIKHSCAKAQKGLIIYWIIFLLFLFLAVKSNLYFVNYNKCILEFLGFSYDSINGDIIAFFWYMPFYIAILFILHICLIVLLKYKNVFRDIVWIVVFPLFLFSFLGQLTSFSFAFKRFFIDLELWFPCVAIGCIAAKYSLFDLLDRLFSKVYGKYAVTYLLVPVALLIMVFYGMYILPGVIYHLPSPLFLPIIWNMSVVYIVFLVYAITKVFDNRALKNNILGIRFIIIEFGRYSLYMWLIHSVFFNVFKRYTQPVLLFPKYTLLILIWGLLICLLLSKLIETLIKKSRICCKDSN